MEVTTTDFQNGFGRYLKICIEMPEEEIVITKNGKRVAKLEKIGGVSSMVIREEAWEYSGEKRVTYEEYLELVENTEERYELIDGEIYYMASPLFKHQVAVNEIFGSFYNWFKGKPCRPLTAPFDVKLCNKALTFKKDPNVVQPDILVMCDEEKVTEDGKYEGIPTLIVEVLSKSTRKKDILKKTNLYMNSGVREYWMVDTDQCFIQVYNFENCEINETRTFFGEDVVKSFVFDGLTVPLQEIFTW